MSELFRKRVAHFVAEHITPHVAEWETLGTYPPALYRRAGLAGLLALGQNQNQLPDDPRAVAILVQELTRSGAQGITMGLASHFVSLKALQRCAPELASSVVPAVLSGECSISLALTEPQAGSDLRGMSCRAVLENGQYRLTGTKAFVCNGERADWLLLIAHSPDGLALFLAEGHAPGIMHTPQRCLGWRCLPLTDLHFTNTPVVRLTQGSGVGRILQNSLLQERLNLAVMAVTSADMALQASIDWCKQRQMGGKPLFDKSVIRQRLAEYHAELAVAQHYVESAVNWMADGNLDPRRVAIAKNQSVAVLEKIARGAVQVHGAHGCIEPALVERIHRDARLLAIGGGTHEIMLDIIGRSL